MTLTVAIQMDHIRSIKIAGDTGFALLLEAQRRGHRVLHYTPDRLSLRDGQVIAMAGTRNASDPSTHMREPARTWSADADRPNSRGPDA